jgi:hypothetical protein
VLNFDLIFVPTCRRCQVSGVSVQVSAPPLAAEAVSLIEKETLAM